MTRTIDAPSLWGIGRYQVDGRPVAYPVGQDDLQRDIGSALKVAGTLGLAAGQRVLVVSTLAGSAQWWPIQVGVLASGAKLSCADANRFDAFRTAMFLRQAPYACVIGVTEDVLDGLESDLGLDLGDVFADVGVAVATPGAAARLAAAGVPTRRFLAGGPAFAVECSEGVLHVDGDEWDLRDEEAGPTIAARNPRAASIVAVPVELSGTVTSGACACGRPDPGIRPNDDRIAT